MKKGFIQILSIAAIIAVILSSCKKEDEGIPSAQSNPTIVQNEAHDGGAYKPEDHYRTVFCDWRQIDDGMWEKVCWCFHPEGSCLPTVVIEAPQPTPARIFTKFKAAVAARQTANFFVDPEADVIFPDLTPSEQATLRNSNVLVVESPARTINDEVLYFAVNRDAIQQLDAAHPCEQFSEGNSDYLRCKGEWMTDLHEGGQILLTLSIRVVE